ncbi:MASE1 domain-containing protein [Salinarimonas sp. NSM]|uniref:MASE1 domain-containing protein n=1 Tax=Salinarimonas sp. NSM TaxID=3458003 RepID=UPI0040373C29
MRSDAKTLAAAAILGLAYYAAAVTGLQWAAVGGAGSPVWPAAGVGLAGLVLGGVRLWPAIVIARLAAGLTVGSTHPLTTELVIALGNAACAALPAFALVAWFGLDRRLAAMRDILALAFAAGIGALISAGFGAGALWLSTGLGPDFALATAAFWWFGAFVGAMTLAPPILAWSDLRGDMLRDRRTRPRTPSTILHLLAVLAVTTALAVHVFLGETNREVGTWLIYPPLIWAALAFQVRGASLALVVVAGAATIGATFRARSVRSPRRYDAGPRRARPALLGRHRPRHPGPRRRRRRAPRRGRAPALAGPPDERA